MPLTPEQKSKVRQAMTAGAEKRGSELSDRIKFEARRDARAYEMTQANLAARAEARTAGKPGPDLLSWGDAQAAAEQELRSEAAQSHAPAKPERKKPAADQAVTTDNSAQ